METRAYRLRLRWSLHVGERSLGLESAQEYVPSDTLFSALIVALSRLPQHIEAIARLSEAFAAAPPPVLSSAFPYVGDTLLLPRPRLALHLSRGSDAGVAKQAKRVRWVSLEIFLRLIDGIEQAELDALWDEAVLVQQGAVWLTRREADTLRQHYAEESGLVFWSQGRDPKVTVDRVHNASTIFHVGRVHFRDGCGLWCLVDADAEWQQRIEEGLRLLADVGLGGRRSQGNGHYTLESMSPPTAFMQNNRDVEGYAVLLSRLSPTPSQVVALQAAEASYDLVAVGGFAGTPAAASLVRKQVRLVSEGSIIGTISGVPGRLVDVTPAEAKPPHPIFRYGFGYTVPVRLPMRSAP